MINFQSIVDIIKRCDTSKEKELLQSLLEYPRFDGKNIVLIDVSGSMVLPYGVSNTSNTSKLDVAVALSVVIKEISDEVILYASGGVTSERKHLTQEIPNYFGFLLANSIKRGITALGGEGIYLSQAISYISHYQAKPDNLLVILDCDDGDNVPKAFGKNNILICLGNPLVIDGFTNHTPESFLSWLKDLSIN